MIGYLAAWRPLVAAIGCCAVVACTDRGSPTAAAAPQVKGAWYQVYFASDKAELDGRGSMIVDRVADVAKRNEGVRVSVIGKTDRMGAPDANMALSEARAERVRNALIDSGVPSSRIDMSWVGERKQDMRTPDDIAEQRNRVVDVLVQLPN